MKAPNVLVTGTPGAGKTYFAKTIAEHSGMEFLEISKIVSENGFTDGYDDTLECPILDEDKVRINKMNKLINEFYFSRHVNSINFN